MGSALGFTAEAPRDLGQAAEMPPAFVSPSLPTWVYECPGQGRAPPVPVAGAGTGADQATFLLMLWFNEKGRGPVLSGWVNNLGSGFPCLLTFGRRLLACRDGERAASGPHVPEGHLVSRTLGSGGEHCGLGKR